MNIAYNMDCKRNYIFYAALEAERGGDGDVG